MKIRIALVAFAALAATGCIQHLPTSSVTTTAGIPTTSGPDVLSQAPTGAQDQVIAYNQVIGRDPDIHIRAELQRNANCYISHCGD